MIEATGPVGVISNPGSGHNREQFARIRLRIEGCRGLHHIITRSPADIEPALRDLAAKNISVLAINGGDGTASAVLGALLESDLFGTTPLIALLPGGTANMNAGDVGVRGSLQKAVNRFSQWCEGERATDGKLVRRALLRVTSAGETPVRHGMFLGAGAIVHGAEYAHKNIHSRGLRDDLSLALSTLRTVWGVVRNDPAFNRHVTVRLGLDARDTQQFDTLLLAISTLKRLSFGMQPFWGDEPGDVRVTLIEQGCTRFARTFFSILRGRANRNAVPASGYNSHNTNNIHIEMQGKLNLDGEMWETAGTVQITATPFLEFLRL